MSVYRHISAERAHSYPVSLMCELLGVSESGFWAWLTRAPSDRALTDQWLRERIKQIHRRSRGNYGSPRVHGKLREQGIHVGRKRVERLMRELGIEGAHVRPRKGTTTRVPGVRPAPDLVGRDFLPDRPDRYWAADIKQIETTEGIVYLAAVQDLFSRRIVGWAMAGHMRAELVVDALTMAVRRRRPQTGLVHHSDQGSQYVSLAFGQACAENGIAKSMGARGDCFDNAVAETFFSTLTKELLLRVPRFATRAHARSAIFEWTESFYNRERLHSTLGMRSPAAFEALHEVDPAAAAEQLERSRAKAKARAEARKRARARARARAKNLFTTFGCEQGDDDNNPLPRSTTKQSY